MSMRISIFLISAAIAFSVAVGCYWLAIGLGVGFLAGVLQEMCYEIWEKRR